MKHPNLKKFMYSFCLPFSYMEGLHKPNYYDNGYIVSSDSSILAMVHDPEFDKKDCLNSKLAAWGVLSPFANMYEGEVLPIGKIEISEINRIYDEIKKLPEYEDMYKDCSDCDGSGVVECDCCGQESDCETCDGEGELVCGKGETGSWKFPEDEILVINDIWLGLSTTYKLLESLKLIDAVELEIYENIKYDRIFYRVKDTDIYILQMGVVHREYKDLKKHIIII